MYHKTENITRINILKQLVMTFRPLKLILFILLICSFSLRLIGQNNPKADDQAVIISGNMRFTILTPEMIRIEWNDAKQFEDRASFIMVNRKLPVPKYSTKVKDGYLYISTEKLELKYKEGSYPVTTPASPENLSISFMLNGSPTHWYPGKKIL